METMSSWEWIRARVLGQLGRELEAAANFVPLGTALRTMDAAIVKIGAKGGSVIFPPVPPFEQLGILPRDIGRAFDLLERAVHQGDPTAIKAGIDRITAIILGMTHGTRAGGSIVGSSFFGRDP